MTSRPDQAIMTLTTATEKLRQANLTRTPRRVCWVTDELVGLFRNGGGGTVVSGFCEALLKGGHEVTVLYTSPADQISPDNARVIRDWEQKGLNLNFLQDLGGIPDSLTQRSYAIHRWLRKREFDIIHFHDFNGSGFAPCTAKKLGIAYEDTLLCVSNFGTARWGWECMELYLQTPGELERDWVERRSVENADVVICQSQSMANWLQRNNYGLPAETYVQPSIIPLMPSQEGPAGRSQSPIREIVFFGRQEVRKGIRVFVAAAEKLSRRHPDLRFSFSGKFSEVDFEHSGGYVFSRLRDIPNDITFLAHLTRDQALTHLKSSDVLAVMPSIDDNFPGAVIEAVQEGIEFIASNSGGIPEIIDPKNHAERLFPPTAEGLVSAVERILKQRPPRADLAFDNGANLDVWMDWHSLVPTTKIVTEELSDPLVSVCLCHFNRPHLVAMTIAGLKLQTYGNFEVVLVDDGSTDPEAIAYVNALETADLSFPLRVVRTPDIRLGAARNAGVDAAAGEYVIFVDDDNVPRPMMVETLVRAAQRQNLDVGTCLAYILSGSAEPNEAQPGHIGYYPAGGPISQGLLENVFGDANAIVRRSTFLKLGGFDPTPGIGAEDWDFFARVVLSGGRLEVVPEALYWYRQHDQQLTTRWHSTYVYQERLLQTYWASLKEHPHPELESALRLYMGHFVVEKLKTASWYNIGVRVAGDYQRQLLPHVNNTSESYKILFHLCTALGRFRDAARLVLFGESPHAHLLELGTAINQAYRAGREDFAQSYYGESGVPRRAKPILPSVLARVRRATPSEPMFDYETVTYSGQDGSIQVHPIPDLTSIAIIDDAFPVDQTILTVEIEVAHPEGPEILFNLMLIDSESGKKLSDFRLPTTYLAKTSLRIGPDDGVRKLLIKLPEPHDERLSIVLATDAVGGTHFGWSKFSAFKVSR